MLRTTFDLDCKHDEAAAAPIDEFGVTSFLPPPGAGEGSAINLVSGRRRAPVAAKRGDQGRVEGKLRGARCADPMACTLCGTAVLAIPTFIYLIMIWLDDDDLEVPCGGNEDFESIDSVVVFA